jgi:nucleotide-binding universal stress UspA family protein
METILIATDFSNAAHNAFIYGVELAKFLNAKVVLLFVDPPVLLEAGLVSELTPEEILECNERLLLEEVASLTSGGTVNIEILAREGPPSETINLEAVQLKAKWIVAGMKGSGKAMRRLFGSTALSMSRHANVPLIVVPEDARFIPPKTIALASDIGDGTDVEIIEPLEEFGVKCNSSMYIVRVIKKGMDDFIERMLRPTRVK